MVSCCPTTSHVYLLLEKKVFINNKIWILRQCDFSCLVLQLVEFAQDTKRKHENKSARISGVHV